MSTTDDTVPAAENDIAESTPLSEIMASTTADRHEAHQEAIAETAEPAAAAAAPPPAPTPAPIAETKVDPAAKPEAEQPFWYRKEIEKERKARQAAERRAAELERTGGPRAPAAPTGEPEDPDRPLTRGELEFYRERDALVGRLERSEERFVDKLGEETFEATREWLATRPDIEEWALKQRDPWKAAHSQFQKEKLASEIGEDPNAWRAAERERIRQEILAEQQGERPAPAPQPAPQMRAAPPAPASTARSSAPRDDAGRFAPQSIGALTKHKF